MMKSASGPDYLDGACAALLMRVQTPFRIFGYPGLAILCFLLAATGGVGLMLSILWQDHKSKQKSAR